MKENSNRLINETSPYLLQHAHNPVDWYPWGDEALQKAKTENKLLLISIGYSACHWCHVMERESFENDSVAQIMNQFFVCVKVDREERPEIDQIYMDAVQLMTGKGGWPLNCFALPDGRPIYGGTYFPKDNWINILQQLQNLKINEPQKLEEYASKLTEGLQNMDQIVENPKADVFDKKLFDVAWNKWRERIDTIDGGPNHAPKFPLPNNFEFLLKYGYLSKNEEVLKYVNLTLQKMAFGGIYDQIGGGFARYSVDGYWKVPHFEKMLYDNAQLVSLYAEAYQASKNELYKQTVYQTLQFVERELTDESGGFYSALDADSEGEEGKFYVWKKEELEKIITENFDLFAKYYNLNSKGLWEHGNYILLRTTSDESFAANNNITLNQLSEYKNDWHQILLFERNKRVRPGLDDKSLTSWNAMMLKAYADAYLVFGENNFLEMAKKNAHFIIKNQKMKDGGLFHNYKNGKSNIIGFLEDYAFTIEAFLKLYEATFDEKWLLEAKNLADYSIENFFNDKSGYFYFTSAADKPLIVRKTETMDNVIPSSNSTMAKNLFQLSHHFERDQYAKLAENMLKNMEKPFTNYPSGYSNWAILRLYFSYNFKEIVIVGADAKMQSKNLSNIYYPNKLLAGSTIASQLPLIKNRFNNQKTLFYLCENKSCLKPSDNFQELKSQLIID